VVAMQPDSYRVTRSATIAAPPAVVFPLVDNLRRWETWSPWAKLDPACKNSFSGPEAGVGAIFDWSGNDQVGEGRMTVTESRPHELVRLALEFFKPFPGTSTTEFTFAPADAGTRVTWTMSGEKDYLSKAMCMFMDMDRIVGGQFDQGLAAMKQQAESAGAPAAR
jgi:hypothetical protein